MSAKNDWLQYISQCLIQFLRYNQLESKEIDLKQQKLLFLYLIYRVSFNLIFKKFRRNIVHSQR